MATLRDPQHATVAVTPGILDLLSWEELESVLAHDISHLRNHDTLTQAAAGAIAGAITFLGRLLTFGALYDLVKMPGFVVANNIFIKSRVKSRTIDFTY